jgi:hypothetical protein
VYSRFLAGLQTAMLVSVTAGVVVLSVSSALLVGIAADVCDFAKDYVIRHDPTAKGIMKTVGVCTKISTAVGQGADQVTSFLAPLAVPVVSATAVVKKLFSKKHKGKQLCHQEVSATTTTTAGSPASSTGADSVAHTNDST